MKAWLLAAVAFAPCPALAEAAPPGDVAVATATTAGIPAQLTTEQRAAYRQVFAAIREQRWTDAQLQLDAMQPGPLHAYARAELFTAKGSPRVELEPLVKLINEAPELPQADALERLATARGATDLPPLPVAQRLIWQDGAPARIRAKAVKSDAIAADLAQRMQPYVKADQAAEAQALLDATTGLSPEAQTEWQARVAWIYFLQGDDRKTRTLADKAASGWGDWAVQGRWMSALAAWRQNDCDHRSVARSADRMAGACRVDLFSAR